MLIHGFAEDGDIWENQVNFLKDHFRLIIPDLPGSGLSELLPVANIETYAEVIKAVVDTELPGIVSSNGCEQVCLIGHSMGGYITLAFAEKHPHYLHSFGLFHSSAFSDNEEKKQVREKAIDFIVDKGPNSFLKTSIPGLFTKEFVANYPEKVNGLIEKGKSFTPDALVQYYKAMIARPDRTMILKNFVNPILFIMGEYDSAIPLQSSLQQCYLPLQSHVHLLSLSAHMGMWEETDRSNQLLLDFLLHTK